MSQPTRPPVKKPINPKRRDLMAGREKVIGKWCLVAFALCVVAFFLTLPDVRKVAESAPGTAIQIFDKDDQLIVTTDGDEEREFVPLANIPKVMQQALIAAEDHNFYNHNGISFRGIMRAFLNNAEAGRVVEGGSTLTQQLAKNLFFESGDRSIIRKAREAVLAVEIEKAYTKDQIMEMYLNQVYFGRSAYGLERAAKRFFGKTSRALTLPEAAYLAGILKAPSQLGDPKNLDDARERQQIVLDEMMELKFITSAQAKTAKKTKLAFSRSNSRLTKFPYYLSAVQEFLKVNIDKDVLEKGGLRVYTNLDQAAQRFAERTVAQRVRGGAGGMNQAALVSMLVSDGSVVALVGGAGDYWKHQYNSATGPHTMGSAFKPFIYLTAFMQGKLTPDTIIDDSPIVVPQRGLLPWVPKNFDGEFYGPMTVREALALSRNICAVRAALAVGIGNVIETAKVAGIKSELIATPALSLGASAASPLEMATAYATFARGGTYLEPKLVRKVEGRAGYKKEFNYYPQKVFPDGPVRALVSCMESVVKEGTGVNARLSDRPVAGKTGTSDQARDLWFVGFTPHMVTAVWGGNDQRRSLGGLTGGAVLTGLWKAYNERYYRTNKVPAGTFYTQNQTNDDIWGNLLRAPQELPKEEQKPEEIPQAEQTPNAEQQQQEQADGQQMPEGRPENQLHFFPLPGAPEPGRVRNPVHPSPNDPFAPFAGEPSPPGQPESAQPQPAQPQPEQQEPPVAPEREAPEPRPAPDYREAPQPPQGNDQLNDLLREPAQ